MTETIKRIALRAVAVGGWLYAIAISTWATLNFDPSAGRFAPQWMTLSVFLAMGFAIASGVALGRITSVRTLVNIFNAGMSSQNGGKDNGKDDDK